jgi:hypothetical protein
MSQFDNRKNLSYRADAPSFSAVITPGNAVQTAVITYKATYKKGAPSVTTSTMDQLMAALPRLDAGCKFYKTGTDAGTLAAKDAAALEAMRVDVANTSDAQYRLACRAFGQKPQPRPTQAANTSAPQAAAPTLTKSVGDWAAFEQAHAELFRPPYGLMNLRAIEAWFADEGAQWTAANLATCYAELKAFGCFRDARTLSRDMNGSMQIVRQYDRAAIVAARRQQVVAQQNAAPAYLSDVDRDVWNAVRAKYPQLLVNSAGFKKCCADTLILWATDFAQEQQPGLAAADKRGELRKAVDAVLVQWARVKKPAQSLSQRIWLG